MKVEYPILYYSNFGGRFSEYINKVDIPFPKDPNSLKELLIYHIKFLRFCPFKINNYFENLVLSPKEKNYGFINPIVELYFYNSDKPLVTYDTIDKVEKTRYGWKFKIKNESYTFYLPDEFFFFDNEDEQKLFFGLVNITSQRIQQINSSTDPYIVSLLKDVLKSEGRSLLDRYVFILTLMNYLKPYFHEKYKGHIVPFLELREGLDYKKIKKEDGSIEYELSDNLIIYLRKLILMYDFYRYFYGPIGHFLRDREAIEEVIINDKTFTQLMSGGRVVSFYVPSSEEEMMSYISQMLIHRNVDLNVENYIINAELPSGDRTAFVHSIVTSTIPNLNIRIFKNIPLSVMDFYYFKNFAIDLIATMSLLENVSSTIFYSGGTGTGKTTALNAFIGLIPKQRFLIIVEDVREMDPFHPPATTRREVSPTEKGFDELVKAALRHSPDSIVFQEIRTPTVMEAFLDAVNTGHAGSMTTFHASTIEELLQRIKGFNLDPESMKGLHYIYFISRFEYKGKQLRRVSSIVEIEDVIRDKNGELNIINNKIFYLSPLVILNKNKEEETQMPIQFVIPSLFVKNPTLATIFRNKYPSIDPNKENILEIINNHALFLLQLFKWIKEHPKWDGKRFLFKDEEVGTIEITLKEFLPEIVTLYYDYLTLKGDIRTKTKNFLSNLNRIGNQILTRIYTVIKRDRIEYKKRVKELKNYIIKLLLEKVEKARMNDPYERSYYRLVEKIMNLIDLEDYGPIIGSRITMLDFLQKTSITKD